MKEKIEYDIEQTFNEINDNYIELNSNAGIDCELVKNAMEKDPIPKAIYE